MGLLGSSLHQNNKCISLTKAITFKGRFGARPQLKMAHLHFHLGIPTHFHVPYSLQIVHQNENQQQQCQTTQSSTLQQQQCLNHQQQITNQPPNYTSYDNSAAESLLQHIENNIGIKRDAQDAHKREWQLRCTSDYNHRHDITTTDHCGLIV
jgi:hypothetical protein